MDTRARDACQPNSLKGAGGVRLLENVDTSVTFSPDECKGEGSSLQSWAAPVEKCLPRCANRTRFSQLHTKKFLTWRQPYPNR